MRYSTQLLLVTLALAGLSAPAVAVWGTWAGAGAGGLAGLLLARHYLPAYRAALLRLGWHCPPERLSQPAQRLSAQAQVEGAARGARAGALGGALAVLALAVAGDLVFQLVSAGAGLVVALLLCFVCAARALERSTSAM